MENPSQSGNRHDSRANEKKEIINNKHTKARATGLKSVLILSDSAALMTTYGKGWESVPEKVITKDEIIDFNDSSILEVKRETPSHMAVSGNIPVSVHIPDPFYKPNSNSTDQLKCKGKLERQFFGAEYADNIHIQVIYNILDIEKILSVYINRVVFAINNIIRTSGNEYTDHIASLGLGKTFSAFQKANMTGKLFDTEKGKWFFNITFYTSRRYFGDMFVKKYIRENEEVFQKRCYAYLCLIGLMRQALVHGGLRESSKLYTLDPQYDQLHKNHEFGPDAREILFSFYRSRVDDINNNFRQLARKDLILLNIAYDAKQPGDKKQVAEDYARYVIKQRYKSLGISLQRLRQNLISLYLQRLLLPEYDDVRKRLYRLIHFILYQYYTEHPQEAEQFILRLRSSLHDQENNTLYAEEAKRIWPELKDPIENGIVRYIMKVSQWNSPKDKENKNSMQIVRPDGNCFCQLILLMSQFLDSREANELISYVADELETIQDLLQIMKRMKMPAGFATPYSIFNNSGIMAKNLREINSFSHMNTQKAYLRINPHKLYFDAARILGFYGTDRYLEDYIENHFIECTRGEKDTVYRNFVFKHIISLPSFGYLGRYGNMDKIKSLMTNPKIVAFVLGNYTKDELKTYSNLYEGIKDRSSEAIREHLTSRVIKVSIHEFETVNKDNQGIKKNLAKLYLEILYRLIKNLVDVNSRYIMAFHCVERDAAIYYSEEFAKNMSGKKDYSRFAECYLKENRKNDLLHRNITKNFMNSDPWSIRQFRNCAAHLGAIRNANLYIADIKEVTSYYALYHYLVQRYLLDQFNINFYKVAHPSKAQRRTYYYLHFSEENGVYNKDFVKALCVPFSYQAARYQNLTVESLFDKNKS